MSARTRRMAAAFTCFDSIRLRRDDAVAGRGRYSQSILARLECRTDPALCRQRNRQLPGHAQRRHRLVCDRRRQPANQAHRCGEFGRLGAGARQRASVGQIRVRRELWRRQRRGLSRSATDGALGEATDMRPSVGPRHHPRGTTTRPDNLRSAITRVRTCTWSLPTRAGSSSSPTMPAWI